ncbi:MAG: M20/M25/M40 family metallo-hydrolase [Alphaproteobacteria bacterium]|nr:M20/M25/M40 family metallo-hydrolase [Alphaproteobacteria bacterium]
MRSLLLAASALTLTAPAFAASPETNWQAKGRELLENVINIPSVTTRPEEVKKLVTYLKGEFEKGGFNDIVVKDYMGTQAMIVRWKASGMPKAKPILLMGHMDVVDAKREDWPRDPFKMVEENGYFYGRGTTDMKNGIVAITHSLLRLKAEGFQPKRDIIVFFSGDEETGGDGARLAATEWRKLVDAEYALNADAGGGAFTKDGAALGFGIQTSEKMFQSFTFTARNPGGHSSRPRPDNAIYDLAAALKKLEAHRFEPMLNETTRAYFQFRQKQEKGALGDAMRRWLANEKDGAAADIIEADPLEVAMTRTRCVATRLEGGHADNALPQTARALVNCRIFPGVDAKAVQAELQSAVGHSVQVEPHGSSTPSPPSPLRADVMKVFTSSIHKRHPGVDIVPQMSTGATDGLYFRANGMPVYGVSGAWIISPEDERAHGKDERLPVKSFYEDLDHWHDMVKALAQ